MMNFFSKLKSLVISGKSMKCEKWDRHVHTWLLVSLNSFSVDWKKNISISWCCSYFFSTMYDVDIDLMQDQGLAVISEGLDTLKDMAHNMNEVCCICVLIFVSSSVKVTDSWNLGHMQELDRQVPLMDEIDTKVRKCIIPVFWTAVISVLLTYNELCFDLSQVDKATSDLKNTNVRLKDTVTQVNELHGLQCLYIFILFF